jgi:hypothetical protein
MTDCHIFATSKKIPSPKLYIATPINVVSQTRSGESMGCESVDNKNNSTVLQRV